MKKETQQWKSNNSPDHASPVDMMRRDWLSTPAST